MTVDWSALGDMLSGIGTIIGAGTVVFAALIGRNTFKQWKRQKQEERRMAAAEQVLVGVYRIKRAFSAIRSPAMFTHERLEHEATLRERGFADNNTPEATLQMLCWAQAIFARAALHNTEFEELLSLGPISKALFGDEIEEALRVFVMQRGRLNVAAQRYADLAMRPEPRTEEGREKQFQDCIRLQNTMWEGSVTEEDDTIERAVDEAILTLEARLLPILRHG